MPFRALSLALTVLVAFVWASTEELSNPSSSALSRTPDKVVSRPLTEYHPTLPTSSAFPTVTATPPPTRVGATIEKSPSASQTDISSQRPVVIVGTMKVNVRVGPGTYYSVLIVANRGQQMEVTGRVQKGNVTWWQVKTANAKTGYVREDVVEKRGSFADVTAVPEKELPMLPTRAPAAGATHTASGESVVVGREYTLAKAVNIAYSVDGPITGAYISPGKSIRILAAVGNARWEIVPVRGSAESVWILQDQSVFASPAGGARPTAAISIGRSVLSGENPTYLDSPDNIGHWRLNNRSPFGSVEVGKMFAECGVKEAVGYDGGLLITLKANRGEGNDVDMQVIVRSSTVITIWNNTTGVKEEGVSLETLASRLWRRDLMMVYIAPEAYDLWANGNKQAVYAFSIWLDKW